MHRLTQHDFLQKILKKCKEKNYTLNTSILNTTINSTTKLHLFCDKGHELNNTTYNNFVNQNKGCSKCSGNYLKTTKEALDLILDKCKEYKYKINKNYIFKYTGANTILHLICNNNHQYKCSYNSFVNQNKKCLKCNGYYINNTEEALKYLLKKCKEKNYKLNTDIKFIYHGYDTKINLICDKNHKWNTTSYNRFINDESSCPYCNESKGEKCIETYLKENNIKYERQYKFKTCKNIRPLPFDFYLPDYNTCIEYQGKQHLGNNSRYIKKLSDFEYIIKNDKIKREYCENNDINFIEIIYIDKKNIEKLLDYQLKNNT
jgi:hypothetical protein